MKADQITAAVADSFARAENPRMARLLPLLVRHLHDFVREAEVTPQEWRAALAFLTDCAAMTSQERNEFILLSDVLGVSSLVDLLGHPPDATPGSVLGPFHNHNSRLQPNGIDLAGSQAGERTLFTGRVSNRAGSGLAHAEIDFWQNAANALYPAQDPAQDAQNLRCKIRCDAQGRFSIVTVRPQPYTVPYDGPVGALLSAANRHCWRPAHFHCIVSALGHASLVTEIFPRDDPYIESDTVFGVRDGLVVPFERVDDAAEAARHGLPTPFTRVRFEFRLAAG